MRRRDRVREWDGLVIFEMGSVYHGGGEFGGSGAQGMAVDDGWEVDVSGGCT